MVSSDYPHTATIWVSSGVDSVGDESFAAPATIKVRWEESITVVRGIGGAEQDYKAQVFVQADYKEGDYIYWGESTETDPTSLDTAYRIKDFFKIPDLSGRYYDRKVML